MSQWADITDGWMEKLKDIPGLEEAKEHRYSSWSMESLGALTNERHIAVWPEGEPEVVVPIVAGSPPEDLATMRFTILLWEDASDESVRRLDDEQANLDWLDLHEAIRDELYDLNNRNLGDPQTGNTRYVGAAFDAVAGLRVMQVSFTVNAYRAFTQS